MHNQLNPINTSPDLLTYPHHSPLIEELKPQSALARIVLSETDTLLLALFQLFSNPRKRRRARAERTDICTRLHTPCKRAKGKSIARTWSWTEVELHAQSINRINLQSCQVSHFILWWLYSSHTQTFITLLFWIQVRRNEQLDLGRKPHYWGSCRQPETEQN